MLGGQADFLGTFASGPFYKYVQDDFKNYNVGIDYCKVYDDCEFPLSSVLINSKNGSRTIIHSNRNLPEVKFPDFEKVNLENYSWIHFEGRNYDEVKKMIQYVNYYNKSNKKIVISVELEKPRWEQIELVPLADVVFVGKDFSMKEGWPDMTTTLSEMKKYVKESALVICTWGEKGAAVLSSLGVSVSPARMPERVVDTLGAGDTFCAAVIFSLLNGNMDCPKLAVDFGCSVAGFKVGIYGYEGLKNFPFMNQ